MRKLAFLVLLAPALLLNACSSGGGGSDTPAENAPHPENWFATHGAQAKPAAPGYRECVVCHGTDFKGGNDVPSCFSCHSFNEAPPFTIHPPSWGDPYISHRAYAALHGTDACKACHGEDLHGEPPAPSCFSASFDGAACHPGGPQNVPHPLDGTFLNGTIHGPIAKEDLTVCQGCHGQPGGPGSNPRFNIGIFSAGGQGCENVNCHNGANPGTNLAHPADWGDFTGSPSHIHYPSQVGEVENISTACTLCHGVKLDGIGGVGPSCRECHTATPPVVFDNSGNPTNTPTGCVSCHNTPPDGLGPAGAVFPNLKGEHEAVGHTTLISDTPLNTCDRCHHGAGTGTVNHNNGVVDLNFSTNADPVDPIIAVRAGGNVTCTGTCHIVINNSDVPIKHTGFIWYQP
jgi:hypothetical protein